MVMWLFLLMIILGAIFLVWRAVTVTPRDKDEYERYMRYKVRSKDERSRR